MRKKLNCILLIDDDEPTNFINRIIIEKSECARYIQVTESAEEALDYLKQRGRYSEINNTPQPELILLDINMPRLSGWDFLERYKEWNDNQKPDPVIVMLTTSMNPEDEHKARQIDEVSGYESKPLSKNKVNNLLLEHFPSYF